MLRWKSHKTLFMGENLKVSRKFLCVLMSMVLCAALPQAAIAAEESAQVIEDEITAFPDDSMVIVTSREAVEPEDFPVTPKVGEEITLRYPDRTVRVQQLSSACTMSYSAYTPYKWDNRARGDFQVSRSSGCSGSVYVSALLSREASGGGMTGEASKTVIVYANQTVGFSVVTATCPTGNYTYWQGTTGGSASLKPRLPCQFYW